MQVHERAMAEPQDQLVGCGKQADISRGNGRCRDRSTRRRPLRIRFITGAATSRVFALVLLLRIVSNGFAKRPHFLPDERLVFQFLTHLLMPGAGFVKPALKPLCRQPRLCRIPCGVKGHHRIKAGIRRFGGAVQPLGGK
jgi:hypothetical protein